MILVDQEEIIEVAADLLGRVHAGIDVKLLPIREGGENAGQHIRLDPGGKGQLRADTLLLRRDPGDLADVVPGLLGERGKGLRQDLDFVVGAVDGLHLKGLVASAEGVDAPGHVLDGPDHLPGLGQGGDDGQQHHHRGQDQHRDLGVPCTILIERHGALVDIGIAGQQSGRGLIGDFLFHHG